MKKYLISIMTAIITITVLLISNNIPVNANPDGWTLMNSSIYPEKYQDPMQVQFDANGADLLVLHLSGKDGTLSGRCREGGAPTYGGVEMVDSGFGSVSPRTDEMCAEMWYLVNPSDGVQQLIIPNANSIFPSAPFYLVPILSAWTGVTSSPNPVDVANFSYNNNSANPQVDLTTTGDDRLIVDILADGHSTNPTGNSHTLLYKQDNGAEVCGAQYTTDDFSGGGTFSWTINSDDWGMIVMSFLPAGAGGDTCTYGGVGDWIVNGADNCSIDTDIFMGGGITNNLRINCDDSDGRFTIKNGASVRGFDMVTLSGTHSCRIIVYDGGIFKAGG